MAISIGASLALHSRLPLDDRTIMATIEEMRDYPENFLPDVAYCFVKADGKMYTFNRDNESTELTGKWREYSSGGGGEIDLSSYLSKVEATETYVAKESGKSLIEDAEIERLAGVDNYDDTDIRTELAKKSDTDHTHTIVNGHTVESDVPVDAKFTDTVYDDTDIKAEIANKADITSIPSKVSDLENDSNYQTAEQVNITVTTEIAKVVADAPEDLNTLKEMSDWIAGHEDDAAAMNSAITDNKNAITALQTGKADKSEIPSLNGYAKTSDLHSHTNKTVLDGITSTKVSNWDSAKTHADSAHAPSTAQANVIETVKVNGTALSVSDKAVNVTMPTKVSELTNDSEYQTKSDITATLAPYAKSTDVAEEFDKINSNAAKTIDVDYMHRIDNCSFAKSGEYNGYTKGYLGQYHKINKMVVIGNSITMHGRSEADGIEWLVDDYREMAATYPNSGWVSLVRNYLAENVNPDIKVYKTNGSVWERQANGSRDYATGIANQRYAEVKQDRSYLIDDGVCEDILTDDVDVIILQLSENMSEPATDYDKNDFATDFKNLYASLLEKCPNAQIFQHCGFWANYNKFKGIHSAMMSATYNIIPIFAPFLYGVNKSYSISSFQSSVGAEILDGEGKVITTVTDAVASHPSDAGFKVMANQTLNALFNSGGAKGYEKRAILNHMNKYNTEIYQTNTKTTQEEREAVIANTLQWFLFPGEYIATITYPPMGVDRHGTLQVYVGNIGNQYLAIKQEIISLNVGWERLWRKSLLSTNSLIWGSFEYPPTTSDLTSEYPIFTDGNWTVVGKYGAKRISELYYTIPNDLTLFSNNWTTLSITYPYSNCQIIETWLIPPSSTQDYVSGKSNAVRVVKHQTNNVIALASYVTNSENYGEITVKSGSILYIKIIEV